MHGHTCKKFNVTLNKHRKFYKIQLKNNIKRHVFSKRNESTTFNKHIITLKQSKGFRPFHIHQIQDPNFQIFEK
jgi:hypothetical protein